MQDNHYLGVVILNYNCFEDSFECIQKLLPQLYSGDALVLIDNNSLDDSYIRLKQIYSQNSSIVFFKNLKNLGYAKGNNIGIQYLLSENFTYICICNPDAIVHDMTLVILKKYLETNPESCCVGPLIIKSDGNPDRNCARGELSLLKMLFVKTPLRIFDMFGINRQFYYNFQYSTPLQVHMLSGAFMMFRSSVLQKTGGFDPETFLYYEEVILFHKIKQKNLGTVFMLPQAKVTHKSSKKDLVSISKRIHILKESEQYYLEHIVGVNPIWRHLFSGIRKFQGFYWKMWSRFRTKDLNCKSDISR